MEILLCKETSRIFIIIGLYKNVKATKKDKTVNCWLVKQGEYNVKSFGNFEKAAQHYADLCNEYGVL
mgnify:FL=1|jgi:hypothetical protein